MYGQDRRQMREVFFRAWQRHSAQQPLTGVEPLLISVALRHPEYHPLLQDPAANEERDWTVETGQSNPFLHMGMHIAIEEQVNLDQPPGVREHYHALLRQGLDGHAVQHRMMDCLGEMLRQAPGRPSGPDPRLYLDCLAQLGGGRALD